MDAWHAGRIRCDSGAGEKSRASGPEPVADVVGLPSVTRRARIDHPTLCSTAGTRRLFDAIETVAVRGGGPVTPGLDEAVVDRVDALAEGLLVT